MFVNDNNVTYRKQFSFFSVNKNWNSLKKTRQKETLQTLNILIKKQINFILETCGKKKNKMIVWTKKKQNITTFNKILKQKLKRRQLLYLLKKKKYIFLKRNKRTNILFLQFMEKIFNFNKKILHILWKLKKKKSLKKNLNLIRKVLKEKKKLISEKNKKLTKYKYKYAKKFKKKKKHFDKKLKIWKNEKRLKNIIMMKKILIRFLYKKKRNEYRKLIFLLTTIRKKKNTRIQTQPKKIFHKITKKKSNIKTYKKKKYKFFQNNLRKSKKKNNKWKKKYKHWESKLSALKIKEFKWKLVNNKNIIKKKKITLNFLIRWNTFYNNTFFNNKKIIKKRKINIASYSMQLINKKVIVFINIFKHKRKFRKKSKRRPLNFWYYNILKKLKKQKTLSSFYKKINNILLSLKIKQNWIKINKAPVLFKTIHAFGFNTKGWRRVLRIIKRSYNLKKFSKNLYFENTFFNTLISCHFKNPQNLTKILGENLRKQWKHRQQLFFMFYLIMSILWQFQLKKITSYRKIKNIYVMVRGKINSNTRTKYFQIKAPYKASFITHKNHMTHAKGISKAKTGIFGIKSWIHY